MANGVEGAAPGAKEAERLGVKAQIDDLRRRIIMIESRLVGVLSILDEMSKQQEHHQLKNYDVEGAAILANDRLAGIAKKDD